MIAEDEKPGGITTIGEFSANLRNPGTKASSNSGFKEDER